MDAMDQIRNVQKMVGKESEEMRKTAREKVWGYIAAALGLVAGLAWNEAIKGLIDHYFPIQRDSVWAKLWYAIIITIVVVFIMVKFEKMFKKDEEKIAEKKEEAQSVSK
jgi:FtsH-binding integral membrane protein